MHQYHCRNQLVQEGAELGVDAPARREVTAIAAARAVDIAGHPPERAPLLCRPHHRAEGEPQSQRLRWVG